jgi:hypothetical protein
MYSKEATCFGFHKAILRPSIDFGPAVYYSARVNGGSHTFVFKYVLMRYNAGIKSLCATLPEEIF